MPRADSRRWARRKVVAGHCLPQGRFAPNAMRTRLRGILSPLSPGFARKSAGELYTGGSLLAIADPGPGGSPVANTCPSCGLPIESRGLSRQALFQDATMCRREGSPMNAATSTADSPNPAATGSIAATPASGQPPGDCSLCPRLAEFRASNCATHSGWHNAPVPPFGDPAARLLVVGLAPGLRGANRTGRPFTGDGAGWPLYAALKEFGFSEGTFRGEPDDGLRLRDCAITNAVRCVPPKNRPTGAEIRTCRQFLAADIDSLPNLRIVLALGRIAHESTVRALGGRPACQVWPWRTSPVRRPCTPRQLSLLTLQHEYTAADPRAILQGFCTNPDGTL